VFSLLANARQDLYIAALISNSRCPRLCRNPLSDYRSDPVSSSSCSPSFSEESFRTSVRVVVPHRGSYFRPPSPLLMLAAPHSFSPLDWRLSSRPVKYRANFSDKRCESSPFLTVDLEQPGKTPPPFSGVEDPQMEKERTIFHRLFSSSLGSALFGVRE